MTYKTIMLELIEERPRLCERLKENRTLLETIDRFAHLLKESHEEWTKRLRRQSLAPELASSMALELALKPFTTLFQSGSDISLIETTEANQSAPSNTLPE